MKEINFLAHHSDLKIVQDKNFFKMSLDSILLPHFIKINKEVKRILDLGTGNAPIPLALSKMTSAKIVGVEIQKEIVELAIESVKMNHLEEQITILNEDIKNCDTIFESESFDIIVSNPPYFKAGENKYYNQNETKTIARHEIKVTLDDVLKVSSKLLKNNGTFAMVHRTDRMSEILTKMNQYRLEAKRIRFVYSNTKDESTMFLVEGRKNGKPGLKVIEPLYIYDDRGNYSKETKKILGQSMEE